MIRKTQEAPSFAFDAATYRKLFPQEYLKKCIENQVRPDSRALVSCRPISITRDIIQSTTSSALVQIGKTSVVAAIKLAVGTPAVATPDQGEVAIQVHLTPLCSTRFPVGRQSEESQSLSSLLTRIIIESRVVEMKDLCIERGKSAWKLFVDVYCMDHDGNVTDASLIATMASLLQCKLPSVSIAEKDHVVSIDAEQPPKHLSIHNIPLTLSFCILDGVLSADPTSEEEQLASSSFSIAYNPEGQLCGVFKAGGKIISPSIIQQAMDLAQKHAESVARMLRDEK